MTISAQPNNDFASRVQAKYVEFVECFPPDQLNDDLIRKLRLEALECILAEDRKSLDMTPLTQAVNALPKRAVEEQSLIQGSSLNLSMLNSGYLNMATTKWLKGTLKPLSADDSIPLPKQLTTFWQSTERAIEQIHLSIKLSALNYQAICALGPYILGEAPWLLIKDKLDPSVNWNCFKETVERIFGKSTIQLHREFVQEVPKANESSASFVCRIEISRSQLKFDQSLCVLTFLPRLSKAFQDKCEMLRLAQPSIGQKEITWQLILNAAKDDLSGASISSYNLPAVSTNINDTNSTYTPPAISTQAPYVMQKKPCTLCTSLGIERAFHGPDGCYLNPSGKSFRKDHFDKKVAYLTRNNIPIPEAMNPGLPPPPPAPTTPARSEGINSFDNFRSFEDYLKKSGMPPHQVASCLEIYKKKLDQEVGAVNMFMDVGDGPNLPQFDGTDCMQATYLDQLVSDPFSTENNRTAVPSIINTDPPPKDTPNAKSSRRQTLNNLIAAVDSLTTELQATGFDDSGSTTGQLDNDARMEVETSTDKIHSAAQTGGIKSQGRIISLGPRTPKVKPEMDNGKIVSRLKLSIPLLRSTQHDTKLRSLLLSELLNLEIQDGRAVVMPEGMIIHQVNAPVFEQYRKALQGVTPNNVQQVNENLRELGIDGRGKVLTKKNLRSSQQACFEEVDPSDPGAYIDSHLLANMCDIEDTHLSAGNPLPDFAEKYAIDCRGMMTLGVQQYIALVQIEKAVTEVVLDTGGHGSIIDLESALQMQLDVTEAVNGNYGHYHSPGYGPRAYAGLIHGPIPIKFSQNVVITIPYLRVITSPRRLIILGADVLCGGRPLHRWNFYQLTISTDSDGGVGGTIHFQLGNKKEKVPLVQVPRIHPKLKKNSAHSDSVDDPSMKTHQDESKQVTFGSVTEIPAIAPTAPDLSHLEQLADIMLEKFFAEIRRSRPCDTHGQYL